MYFYTTPEAEHKFLSALSPGGEQCWSWLEFALQIPYFLLKVRVETEECTFDRHFLFGNLDDLMGAINNMDSGCSILNVGLLSPAHMNGGDCYNLGSIKEIWDHPTEVAELFVMKDGTCLHYPLDGEHANKEEMNRVLCL